MQAEAVIARSAPARKVIPIVPYSVKGRYRNIKSLILNIAFGVYFLLPWLPWQNEVGQALLFDIGNSRFHILGLVLYPQDLMVLMGVMVIAASLLFISAAMFGRIFCGFFCFQTLWTDAFRFIEKWIQGEAQARKRLQQAPWSARKIALIGSTHALWLLLSFATAVTFTLYFADAGTLLAQIFAGKAAIAAYVTVSVLTATTYVAAGFAREDVCFVACPYGKFQGVMQDPSTVTVIYDEARGEREHGRQAPTAKLKTPEIRQSQGFGDCIDCNYCVNVCPTGVDIRKGFQIGCISCGLCVDACNNIMDSLKLPHGLIRFDRDENIQETDTRMQRWTKAKRAGYLAVLVASIAFTWHATSTITPFTAIVQQQRQPLVTQLADGSLRNRYELRITNKSGGTETYRIEAQGLPEGSFKGWKQITIPAGKSYASDFSVSLPPALATSTNSFIVRVTPQTQPDAPMELPMSYFAK
ncbi:cytochrome c oxidase accessory protein CcoG [Methylobacillus arboreus]|uniref:cytochrome c oxidase accessory protein CcoG n=1 Tax=Methylobacillus arboreus TaxID=755170 RepID=UPI001E39276C|nr:cytochrome c oxidase accessory protein CcoG [Methylobacillus arboreus]MCB5191723.1 cytochrome c oxidase accessory protein CcoG [Methylobacillus arboreus]